MPAKFGLSIEVKKLFFDRRKVLDKIGRANARSLSKAGAFVRRRARSSIRRRKAVSQPGSPPSCHSTDKVATLKNILFAYEPRRQSVVVGPVKLHGHQYVGSVLTSGTVPETLEFGRTVGLREKMVGKRWVSMGRRRPRPGQPVRVRKATIRARPFMRPALDHEADSFPELWADSVRGP